MRSFQSSSCWLSPMSKRPQRSKGREKQKNYLFLKLYKKGKVNSSGRYIQTLAIHKLQCHGVVVVPMTRSDVLVLVLCLLKVAGEHQPSCNQWQLCCTVEPSFRVSAVAWERRKGKAAFRNWREKVLVLATECCCRSCPDLSKREKLHLC